jgi:hypothetical protein
MKVMTKTICLLLLLLGFSLSLFAQEKKIKILFVPPKYFKPHEGTDVSEAQQSTDIYWVVYSDRPINKTYTNSTGLTAQNTMDFLDEFFVVAEQDEWIHIYKEPQGVESSDYVSDKAVDYGWVKKDLMLLWRKCLYTDKEVSKKAMVLNTEASVKNAIKKGEESMIKFYKDPQLTTLTTKESTLFQIFFIYKVFPDNVHPTSVLLGYRETISQGVASDDIWGWVDYKRITAWDHRVAILPNTDANALRDRKNSGIKATVLMDVPSATKFYNNKTVSDDMIFWNADQCRSFYIGSYMRFPVLWDVTKIKENNGIMKVGVMGEILSSQNEMEHYKYAEIKNNFNTSKAKSRNMNLIFVVDGTTSMGSYYRKMAEAIVQVMKQLEAKSKNTFKFAAVVYRDYAEEERMTEVIPLTSNASEVAGKLLKVEAIDHADKDAEEAMYYGIKNAIRSINVPEDQTNYLILVGDAGNHNRDDASQVPASEIVELLYKFNYNFLAYQVHNPGGNNAYSEFIRQNREILDQISMKQYEKIRNFASASGGVVPNPPKMRMDGNLRKYVMDNPVIYGSVCYAIPGNPGDPEKLKNEIIAAVNSANDTTDIVLDAVNQVVMEGKSIQSAIDDANKKITQATPSSDKVDFFGPGVWLQLAKSKIPPENMQILQNGHYQAYFIGHTPMKNSRLTSDLWQYELFYTSDEFFEVKNSFKKLIEARTANDRRKCFKEAWKQLLAKSLGERSTQNIESMFIEDVERMVFGLPGTSEFLKLRLTDIDDQAKLSNTKLNEWMVNIEKKSKKLENIFNSSNGVEKEYSFDSNDLRYYWIPQQLLP